MVTESRSVTVYIDDKHDKPTTMNHHSSILGAAIGDISGSAHESFRNETNFTEQTVEDVEGLFSFVG